MPLSTEDARKAFLEMITNGTIEESVDDAAGRVYIHYNLWVRSEDLAELIECIGIQRTLHQTPGQAIDEALKGSPTP
jgi:hypothetical protein